MIRNIIFDLGGVLLDLDMPKMMEKFKALGTDSGLFFVKTDNKNTSTVCNGMSASSIITDYQVGKMNTDDLVNVIQKTCKEGVTREDVVNTWNACLGDLPMERLEAIKTLRSKGYKTYILSNINDLHWIYIEQNFFSKEGYKCEDLFDGLFLSHEVHLSKPMPEIYHHVLNEISSNGEDCLFIDDSAANAEGAQKEGIPSEWLDLSKEDIITLLERINLI